MLLSKGLEQMLLVLLTHTDTGVGTDELEPGGVPFVLQLSAGQRHRAVVLVVPHRVAE